MRCHPFPFRVALLLGVLLPMSGAATADGALGSLFYNPGQRQAIERARVSEEPVQDTLPETVSLNGWVKRAEGKGTVWINGEPWAEGNQGFLPRPPAITSRGIVLQGQTLQMGESLDLTSGVRSDSVPTGAVSTNRPISTAAAFTRTGR